MVLWSLSSHFAWDYCHCDFIFVLVILKYVILRGFIAHINFVLCGIIAINDFIFFVVIIINYNILCWDYGHYYFFVAIVVNRVI